MASSHISREEQGAVYAMLSSSEIISEMVLESHTVQKFDFLKLIIHSQII